MNASKAFQVDEQHKDAAMDFTIVMAAFPSTMIPFRLKNQALAATDSFCSKCRATLRLLTWRDRRHASWAVLG